MSGDPDVSSQALQLVAADGVPLAATLYEPGARTECCVLIAGALGVAQRFYAPFARFLAERGHRVLTFDLRGIGASRSPEHRRSLAGLQADLLLWARQDFAAAVHWLAGQSTQGSIALVGHSLGTHHAAMTLPTVQARIDRVVSVAAGSGYWRDWAGPSRRKAPLMLHLAGPLLTPWLGYFPGKRLRMVGDLPGPAMTQWARWCRHPGFAWGAEPALVLPSLQAARFRIHALSFTDDEAMTERCTRQLLAALPNAPSTLQVIAPDELGVKSIGHLGAFRDVHRAGLWPLIDSHLRRMPT